MTPEEILQLYDEDERYKATMPGMRREVDGRVVRQINVAEAQARNFILYSDLDQDSADVAIARQRAYFEALGRPVEWKLYSHDQPVDLAARLAAGGFEPGDEDAILVLELAQAPEALLRPLTADVRRLTDAADLQDVRDLLSAVWQKDFSYLVKRMTRLMAADAYASIYLAYAEGQPAAAAWAFFPQDSRFASMWAGSTLPAYRGRGLYKALVAARAQEALARGYQFLTIDAGPMSRPIVERYGFKVLAAAQEFVFQPSAAH